MKHKGYGLATFLYAFYRVRACVFVCVCVCETQTLGSWAFEKKAAANILNQTRPNKIAYW
jgi:hypothetical protein